jgi:hypothetical protein
MPSSGCTRKWKKLSGNQTRAISGNDFFPSMRTSEFNLNPNKLIDAVFLVQNENGAKNTELGVGVGPLKDLM